jgi:hypothetical protein
LGHVTRLMVQTCLSLHKQKDTDLSHRVLNSGA